MSFINCSIRINFLEQPGRGLPCCWGSSPLSSGAFIEDRELCSLNDFLVLISPRFPKSRIFSEAMASSYLGVSSSFIMDKL